MKHLEKKLIHIRVEDFKCRAGRWHRNSSATTNTHRYNITSNSGNLYWNLMRRIKEGGDYQKRFPTYGGSSFDFESFQHMAEWLNYQDAWQNRNPNGKLWALDKDILVKGNKSYSPHTCCIVPEYVNNLFVNHTIRSRGDLPIGVTRAGGRSKRFKSRCTSLDGRLDLGNFITPEEAHREWQKAKVSHFEQVISIYEKEDGSRKDVVDALFHRAKLIEEDLYSGEITLSV